MAQIISTMTLYAYDIHNTTFRSCLLKGEKCTFISTVEESFRLPFYTYYTRSSMHFCFIPFRAFVTRVFIDFKYLPSGDMSDCVKLNFYLLFANFANIIWYLIKTRKKHDLNIIFLFIQKTCLFYAYALYVTLQASLKVTTVQNNSCYVRVWYSILWFLSS